MSFRALVMPLLLAGAVGTVPAATELVLRDGRIIEGAEVRRDGGEYVVELDSGDTIVVPSELVDEVRLIEESAPPPTVEEAEPVPIAGGPPPEGPSGIRQEPPQTLAGVPVDPPDRSEQLEVLGPQSSFRPGVVHNDWRPSTDWNMDPEEQNDFNRSKWGRGPVDPTWRPKSTWDAKNDVLAESRSTWTESVVDNTWTPTDGFASSRAR